MVLVEDLGFEPPLVRLVIPCPPLTPEYKNLGKLSQTGNDHIFPVILTLSAYKVLFDFYKFETRWKHFQKILRVIHSLAMAIKNMNAYSILLCEMKRK